MKGDAVRVFKQGELERIARILGDTSTGLTGAEIGHILRSVGIPDVDPENTKWKRLCNAFAEAHNQRKSDNHVLSFIAKALEPARFAGDSSRYGMLIDQLNTVLAFHGLSFYDVSCACTASSVRSGKS